MNRAGISLPMALTGARFALAPLVFVFVSIGSAVGDTIALGLLAAAMFTDFLDGRLARASASVTNAGKLLDPLADAFVFLGLFLGLVARGWMPPWLLGVFVYRELAMHGFVRPYMRARGIVVAASPLGKAKTVVQTAVGLGVLASVLAGHAMGTQHIVLLRRVAFWALCAAAVLSVVSFLDYMAVVLRSKRPNGKPRAGG